MDDVDFVPKIEELTVPDEVATSLEASEQLKREGNEFFKQKEFEKSLEKYASALSASHPSCAPQMAVYHCNSAACHIKLSRFGLGREACDRALELNGEYVKALMRRILCLEQLEDEKEEEVKAKGKDPIQQNWEKVEKVDAEDEKEEETLTSDDTQTSGDRGSSISSEGESKAGAPETETKPIVSKEEAPPAAASPSSPSSKKNGDSDYLQLAVEDCIRWLELEPESEEAASKKEELEKRIKVKQEELQEEVMGKLKDFGNTILGKFGLSLDNFKAEKDPETGSYSINFNQNK
jgi:tetratricopeptide (TPR) repeat protein